MRTSSLSKPMRKPQGKSHVIQTKAPPVGGLDSINPLALMPETNAVELDNFISADNGLAVREGWYEYVIGLGAPVRTVMSYEDAPANAMISPASESELFAATDEGIWLIEGGGGDMSAEPFDIALTGQAFAGCLNCTQYTTNGGNFLIACSETDGAFLYDGAAWLKYTEDVTPGPGVVQGADPTRWVQVVAFKHRLGFVQRESTVAWFLPLDSVGGEAKKFDFGPVFQNGGGLLAMVNWTQDAGLGIDDRLCVLSTAGDLAVYQGTDPTDATAFALVGVWFIGQPPVGRRCFTTSGGNVYVLTEQGLVPISQIVSGGLDNLLTAGTDMLQKLRLLQDQLSRDFASLLYTPGWELINAPAKSVFIVNRPRVTSGSKTMYVFNRHTNAWARLLDIPSDTVTVRLNEVFAGTNDGRVLRILDGFSDKRALDGSGGQHIRSRVTPAFSYFGAPDVVKQAEMLRAVFLSRGAMSYEVRMNADYFIAPASLTPIEQEPSGALWDHAQWNHARWATAMTSLFEWRGVEGLGYALAPTLFVSSKGRTVLTAIEYMMKAGGPL